MTMFSTAVRNRRIDRRAALGVEGAEVDQDRIGAGDEGADFLRRNRHRRHRSGREQHVRRILLRHRIGNAMHPRAAIADARKHVGGNFGEFEGRMHRSVQPRRFYYASPGSCSLPALV